MEYPSGLPAPLQKGYAIETVSPMLRSQLASGRARQREIFDNVPQNVPVQWLFNGGQAQTFVTWFRHAISNGASWFEMPLRNEFGCSVKQVRFASVYKGPALVGPNLYSYEAEIEIYERETYSEDWVETGMLDWITYSNIFDIAMNRKWPEA